MSRKKILFITRHAVANYGSLLQAIATQKVLQDLGNDCELIDYIRTDEYHANSTITIAKSRPKLANNFLLFAMYFAIRLPENIFANRKFEKMRGKYLSMTRLCHSTKELCDNLPDADIYMTGSDQVWGPILYGGYDWNYFLDFVGDDKKKIAFASSFGKMDISDKDSNQMKKLLSRYDSIAVRESQAEELLNDWGINAKQVLDPTFLLNAEQWKQILPYKDKGTKQKYVLIYEIHNNKKLDRYAKEFAKKMNLPLVRVSSMPHQITRGGKFVATPNVVDFLSYINNAQYIVTDSFHGTAFAINFNVPFVTLMPETGTSARNISLLKLTGLMDRVALDENDFSVLDRKVDFSNANIVLEEERIKSMEVLKSMI